MHLTFNSCFVLPLPPLLPLIFDYNITGEDESDRGGWLDRCNKGWVHSSLVCLHNWFNKYWVDLVSHFRYSSSSFSRVYGQQQPSARMSSFLQAPHSCSQWPSRYDQCVYGKTDWWTVDDRLQIQIHRPYFLHAVDIIMSPRSASMSISMLQEFDFYTQRFYISNRYNDHESINRSGLYEFNFQRLLVLYWYAPT